MTNIIYKGTEIQKMLRESRKRARANRNADRDGKIMLYALIFVLVIYAICELYIIPNFITPYVR